MLWSGAQRALVWGQRRQVRGRSCPRAESLSVWRASAACISSCSRSLSLGGGTRPGTLQRVLFGADLSGESPECFGLGQLRSGGQPPSAGGAHARALSLSTVVRLERLWVWRTRREPGEGCALGWILQTQTLRGAQASQRPENLEEEEGFSLEEPYLAAAARRGGEGSGVLPGCAGRAPPRTAPAEG